LSGIKQILARVGPEYFVCGSTKKILLMLHDSKPLNGWSAAFYVYGLITRSFHFFEGCVKILESSSSYIMFTSLNIGDNKVLFELLIYKIF